MNSWPSAPLEALTDPSRPITYGVVKPGDEPPQGGVRFIRGGDIFSGKINVAGLRTISKPVSDQYRRTLLRGGELVVSLVGFPGEVAIVPPELAGANLARQVGLVALGQGVDAYFVKYVLMSPFGRAALLVQTTGTAQQVINLGNLRKVSIPLPPLPIQRRIASILGAYDDLIEVNRRRIAVLEEMARRLFDEWFVHFRFPGHEGHKMVETEHGRLPEGQAIQPLEALSGYISRGIAPTYDDQAIGLVINQKCIRDGRLSLNAARRQRKPVPTLKLVQTGDILVNSTGTGTLGRIAQVEEVPDGTTVDSHVTIIRPRPGLDPDYLGAAVGRLQALFEAMAVGATNQMELNRSRIAAVAIAVPSTDLSARFGKIVRPIRSLTFRLERQTDRLAASRDLLLPRLISGDLSVTAAERELETAA